MTVARFKQHIAQVMLLGTLTFTAACNTTTVADAPKTQIIKAAESSTYAEDRSAIIKMAGDFKVTFDFQETVAFQENYTPKDRYKTGAHEIVRVIEDRPNFISLQHILVVSDDDGSTFPVKHWRQDWIYEPTSIVTYDGANIWHKETITAAGSKGKWAQIVYQVDDAPRYAAVAAWSHENGVSSWTSPPSKRPLPRRDATKRDDYHVIVARNRHAITPQGWVHEQDNAKVVLSGAEPATLVHEIGINTYIRDNSFDTSTALTYWDKTKGFWAEIRESWNNLAATHDRFGLTVLGEPTEIYMAILGIASEVEEGTKTASVAAKEAEEVILEHTLTAPQSVRERLNGKQG
ncbi:DUF6607 family protein [Kordiimonas pumila]|uniref:DUF6607 family protein n=1 Tax=Kordiimonas pumila TaxID=2161677 RepID=A0ABV7D7H2_9PROT|nr:DUF6607 family protein [Kordiimonas pumila]